MLLTRILSSLILAPLALAAVWFGSWALVALAALCGVLMAWEWTRLTMGRFGAGGAALALMAAAVAVLGLQLPAVAPWPILAAALAAPLVQRVDGRSPLWLAAGALYIGLPVLALVWVRGQGRETVFWLLCVVWATDIGAYAAGRIIGGPKLMPRVSPKKTWAGLAGGIVSAAVVGWGAATFTGMAWPALTAISGALAVVSQAGDLAESGVKRYFGVKDSSGIIPGHGGVLDRLDGLLAAAPVVAVLCWAFRGGLAQWG